MSKFFPCSIWSLYYISQKKKEYILIATSLLSAILIILMVILKLLLWKPYKGAIVTNGLECSAIAKDIFLKGGTVADAAIAALFCEGVTMPQSMSLGAGFLMTIYHRNTKEAISLNARETAPSIAKEKMFGNDSNLSLRGGLSVAVPGQVRGYWALYKKFGGGVPWKNLIQPTIDLCKLGIKVTAYVAYKLDYNKEIILKDPVLSEIFVNNKTNDLLKKGDIYYRYKMAKTLEIIAKEGGEALNNGSLTEEFVKDIQNHGGIVTIEDMKNYSPKWQTPISTTLAGGHIIYSQPPPGCGPVLTMILNMLDNYLNLDEPESLDNYQKIVETFKFAYARRTLLGDPDFVDITKVLSESTSKQFAESIRSLINLNSTINEIEYYGANSIVPEDHGTANICLLAPNGDAIIVTSTQNYLFGAGFASPSTHINFNDEMDDFSSPSFKNKYNLPPSLANFIQPGKQPLSSMAPSIIVNEDGDVEMLVGAAGGSKIITGIAQVIIRHLWYKTNLQQAFDAKKLHHQLWPMQLELDNTFKTEEPQVAQGLKKIGHKVSFVGSDRFALVTSISTIDRAGVVGAWDKKKTGVVSYL